MLHSETIYFIAKSNFYGPKLVALHYIRRVFGCGTPRAEGYKADGYGKDNKQGSDIEPPRLSGMRLRLWLVHDTRTYSISLPSMRQPSAQPPLRRCINSNYLLYVC